tara:strand:- start:133 stop:768 length:636 start_codon:yes stop_codon:yes gene_type:complete
MNKIETAKEAKSIMISLGKAGKMPCPTYNTPATMCKTGARLRLVEGSTCYRCYAMKGNYLFPDVQEGLMRRFNAFNHPRWVEAMSFMINKYCTTHFRWFDSGDLADISMLEKIVMVCQNTSKIRHWLPTREVKVVKDYLKIYKKFPSNLVVRVSAPMIDGEPLKSFRWTSTVHHKSKAIGHDCPSRFQDNKCNDCRACWDKRVTNVSYHKH